MRHLTLMDPEMVRAPILESPGFAKKGLSDYHLDLARRCGGQCSYCSTAATTPMRVNRERLKALAAEQDRTGDPTRDPGFSIAWDADEVMRRLEAQIATKAKGWGTGKVLMLSQLTDAFLGYPLTSGLTRRALDLVLARTGFRVRVLTKSDVVGREPWLSYFREHKDRVVVGLSVGSLDDAWAMKVEAATSKPNARIKALRRLQDAGVPTFGMLCPIFPDALGKLDALLDAIRPEICETVWDEPYNDRDNWRSVRDGYQDGTYGWNWLTDVYMHGDKARWSTYATQLYTLTMERARRDGWARKRRYLLYEDQITKDDATAFAGLEGVLLQSKPIPKAKKGQPANPRTGYSPNPWIAVLQMSPEHGRIGWMPPTPHLSPAFPVDAPQGCAE